MLLDPTSLGSIERSRDLKEFRTLFLARLTLDKSQSNQWQDCNDERRNYPNRWLHIMTQTQVICISVKMLVVFLDAMADHGLSCGATDSSWSSPWIRSHISKLCSEVKPKYRNTPDRTASGTWDRILLGQLGRTTAPISAWMAAPETLFSRVPTILFFSSTMERDRGSASSRFPWCCRFFWANAWSRRLRLDLGAAEVLVALLSPPLCSSSSVSHRTPLLLSSFAFGFTFFYHYHCPSRLPKECYW